MALSPRTFRIALVGAMVAAMLLFALLVNSGVNLAGAAITATLLFAVVVLITKRGSGGTPSPTRDHEPMDTVLGNAHFGGLANQG